MEEVQKEDREKIIRTLAAKGAIRPCPRCGNASFTLVGGYINHFVQSNLGGVTIGGPSVPTVAVVCTNCGWLAEHALGALGLLPEKKDETVKERP